MFNIRELSKEFDVTTRTLRYYEEIGILKPIHEKNKRLYSEKDKFRLGIVTKSRQLGFSLNEFALLFELYDESENEDTNLFRLVQILRSKKRALQQKKQYLEEVFQTIDNYEKACLKKITEQDLNSWL